MRGAFVIGGVRIPNNIVDEGEQSFLKMIGRADVTDVAAGGNFYIGLCGVAFDETSTLATLIASEPTIGTGGYARQPVARNNVGWPTLSLIGGIYALSTLQVTFTGSGPGFNKAISRAFLCNVLNGTAGKLFAVSGALPQPITIGAGVAMPVVYELYLR